MSEDALRALLERIESDEAFCQRLTDDVEAALQEFDLSPVESMALAAADEEAMRRLTGADTAAFGPNTRGCALLTRLRECAVLVTRQGCNTGPACGPQTQACNVTSIGCEK